MSQHQKIPRVSKSSFLKLCGQQFDVLRSHISLTSTQSNCRQLYNCSATFCNHKVNISSKIDQPTWMTKHKVHLKINQQVPCLLHISTSQALTIEPMNSGPLAASSAEAAGLQQKWSGLTCDRVIYGSLIWYIILYYIWYGFWYCNSCTML